MSKGEGIRRVSYGYHYFLVKPAATGDVHRSARRMMSIGHVREVVVTEGEYGFVVKADGGCKAKSTATRIHRVVRGEISSATGHYLYVKKIGSGQKLMRRR